MIYCPWCYEEHLWTLLRLDRDGFARCEQGHTRPIADLKFLIRDVPKVPHSVSDAAKESK